MSTVDKFQRKRHLHPDTDLDVESDSELRLPRGKRRGMPRWPLVLLLILGGAAAVLWFLPAIIAGTSMLNYFVARAASDLKGTVHVESASLSWLSPVVLNDVEVRDAKNEPVLEVDRLDCQQRLLDLVFGSEPLGKIRLQGPQLKIVLRDKGSNVEDLLAEYLKDRRTTSKQNVTVEVVDGSVLVVDTVCNKKWPIEKLQLTAAVSTAEELQIKIEAQGAIDEVAPQARFTTSVQLARDADPGIASVDSGWHGQISLTTQSIPLAMCETLLKRFTPVRRLDGRLTSKLQVGWRSDAAEKTFLQGTAAADDLHLSLQALGNDELRFKQLKTSCQIAWPSEQIEVKQLTAECELGNVSLTGTVPARGDFSIDKLMWSLPKQAYAVKGQLDLAALARMLPGTLRIREQTQFTSGQLQWDVSSRQQEDAMLWQGKVEATGLKAVHEGRTVEWEQPVAISFAAHETPLGPTVDRFECQSSFLQVSGKGRADDLSATAKFDLSQLLGQLGQVVDLGGVRLAGTGEAQWTWKRGAKQDFSTQLQFQAREFLFEMPDVPPWSEASVEMTASANGRSDLTLSSRVDKAELRVAAGSEVFEAKLTRSLRDLSTEDGLPIDIRSQGQLEGCWARLKAWYPVLQNWQPTGKFELTAQGTLGRKTMTVGQASLGVNEFQLVGPGLKINEPRVQMAAVQGTWDRPARRLDMKQALFQSSAFATAIDRLQFSMPNQAPATLTGSLGYQGNLERLQAWFFGPLAARGWQLGGTFTGQGELRESAGVLGGSLDTTVNNMFMINGNGRRLTEPQIRLAVKGDYNLRSGAIQVQQCDLASTILAFTLTGRVDNSRMRSEAELSGNVRYDLERLSHVWQPYLGDALQIVGSGTTPAYFRGPLSLVDAQAGGGVNWSSGSVYGFPVGPGTLKATLANGTIQVEPISLDVSQGKVQLRPIVRLAQVPADLLVESGLVARQVHVTPDMCNALLKYAVPAVAGVTQAEGRLSLELEGCRVPLADPRRADISGKVLIHSLDIAASPLIQEFATILGRNATARLSKESVVPFELRQGRVYHQGMELVFQDVTVKTSGSVGLDHSMNLMAESPIPQRLAGNNPTLSAALRDQTLQLPITGTLERPTLDRRALDNVNRRFMGNAARNVIEDGVQKQLNRLLTPPKQ